MTADEALPPEEFLQRAGRKRVLQAVLQGALSYVPILKSRDIASFTERVNEVLKLKKERAATQQNLMENGGEVYVMQIAYPAENTVYYTLMSQGIVEHTLNETGGIDLDNLSQDGLVGYESLDHLFQSAFSEESIPTTRKRNPRKPRGPNKKKKRRRPREPRVKVQHVIDRSLLSILQKKAPFLTARTFYRGSMPSPSNKVDTRAELEKYLGQDQVADFVDKGFNVTLQPLLNFVSANRTKIEKSRKKRLNSLVNREDVTTCIAEYLSELGADEDMTKPFEFLSVSSNARHGFEYFSKPENNVKNVSAEEMIDALRYVAIQHFENEDDKVELLNASMHGWISVAKAAKFIEGDGRIQRILPLFDEAKDQDYERFAHSEPIYEGVRQLGKSLLDRSLHYTPQELPFMFNGLWLLGYFTKRGRKEELPEGEEKTDAPIPAIDRELRGLDRQYISPMMHLMRRFERYDNVLAPAFDRLLDRSEISEELELKSQRQDTGLGIQVYHEIPENIMAKTFTQLRNEDVVLAKPRAKGEGEGTTMTSILTLYVGTRRDSLIDKVRQHYDAK